MKKDSVSADPLADLYPQWRAWLAVRFPTLRAQHGDLMQQTAEDLLRYLRNRPNATTQDYAKLGMVILRRRVADHFRDVAREWARESLTDDLPESNPRADPERVNHYAQRLRQIVALIAELPEEDRQLLLAGIAEISERATPLSDADRQRIRRLRQWLTDRAN